MLHYEWDPRKAAANLSRHQIDFADAVSVFEDDSAITMHDDHPDEDRYLILGKDARDRVLVVVFTYRDERVRIISARKATRAEADEYRKE